VRGRAFAVVEPRYDEYVRSLVIRRLDLARKWRLVTEAERRRWLADADAAGARGDFFMSLNFYAAAGRR
jgi:hypothetical protein